MDYSYTKLGQNLLENDSNFTTKSPDEGKRERYFTAQDSLEETSLIPGGDNTKSMEKTCRQCETKNAEKKIKILTTLDILFSIFVVTPLVVACWRGVWQLMDIYMVYFPAWESFLIGISVGAHIILALGQENFHSVLIGTDKGIGGKILSWILRKLYTFIFNIITNVHWRACWIFMEYFFELDLTEDGRVISEGSSNANMFTLICFLILGVMKCLRNLGGPPFAVVMDKGDEMFLFPTMFRQDINEKTFLYVLDCFFSVAVVQSLGILVWRGFWGILDIVIFPEDEIYSAWGSLVGGYIIVGIVFLLQPLMKSLCENLTGKCKLLAADFFITLSVVATIAVWRGIWNLLNVYFLPDDEELSCWLTYLVSFVILALLDCSNSLLTRGVYIDAEEPGGDCVIFPCQYLQQMFLQEGVEQRQCCDGDTDSQSSGKDEKSVVVTISASVEGS